MVKRNRIENLQLSIELFGAFSAGKSSFSNALLGKRILPVSPNPTTAVINRIRPSTENFRSGTVLITYKSDEVLTNDLVTITKDLSPKAKNVEQFVEWINKDNIAENPLLSSVYQSYLKAISTGYEVRKPYLGKTEQ